MRRRLAMLRASLLAENLVDLPACVVDDVEDALLLISRGWRVRTVPRRRTAGPALPAGFIALGSASSVISSHRAGLDLGGHRAAFLGELEGLLAAFALGRGDQTLVDQQLQGGVDRAGARLLQITAAGGDFLRHLVPVHQAFGEQGQDRARTSPRLPRPRHRDRRDHVGPPKPGTAEAGTEARPESSAEAGTDPPVERTRSGRPPARGCDRGTRGGRGADRSRQGRSRMRGWGV